MREGPTPAGTVTALEDVFRGHIEVSCLFGKNIAQQSKSLWPAHTKEPEFLAIATIRN